MLVSIILERSRTQGILESFSRIRSALSKRGRKFTAHNVLCYSASNAVTTCIMPRVTGTRRWRCATSVMRSRLKMISSGKM